MRNRFLRLLVFLIFATVVTTVAQDGKVSLDVLDYYKNSISSDLPTLSKLESEITVKDLKNGYLKIENDSFSREVVLFGKDSANPFLIVVIRYCDPTNNSQLLASVFSLEGSELKHGMGDNEVLPRLSDRENLEIFNSKRETKGKNAKEIFIDYEVLQGGKLIRVKGSETGKNYLKLYDLRLDKDTFVIAGK